MLVGIVVVAGKVPVAVADRVFVAQVFVVVVYIVVVQVYNQLAVTVVELEHPHQIVAEGYCFLQLINKTDMKNAPIENMDMPYTQE